jgi:hypothetical protein
MRMPGVPAMIAATTALLVVAGAREVGAASRSCHATTFAVEVQAGAHFEQALGEGLTFQLEPEQLGPDSHEDGWHMTVAAAGSPTDDYIYPVNPPLRFNGTQIFGPIYGDDAKTVLSRAREVHFLLRREDYDRLAPLLTNALWPYSAPRPEAAADEYETALTRLVTGRLAVTVVSYETMPGTDSLRRLALRVEVTTPARFAFAPDLTARPTACPRERAR